MSSDVTRDEFAHLAARVDVVEREVEGKKMVTRHVLEQTRHNGDDLAAIKGRLDRVEGKVDGLATDMRGEFASVRQDMTGLRGMVAGLTANLPTMIGDVMRQVLRERGGKD